MYLLPKQNVVNIKIWFVLVFNDIDNSKKERTLGTFFQATLNVTSREIFFSL